MAKINELLGLDESGRAVKTQNIPAQQVKNIEPGANPAPGSSSSQKNEGEENDGPRSLVTIPTENRASDVTRFVVTEQKDKDGNIVTPHQDIRIGHLNTMTDARNTREDAARADNDRLISLARERQAARAREDAQKQQKKRLTYAEMVDKLYPEQAEARRQADEARDAKKRRREAVISALGDGLTTIANLGSVIGGANPVQHETMSERSQARWDKIKADKDARRDAYRAARIRAQQADQEREDALATAERAAKQHADDNAREDAYRLMQLKNQRDIAGLRTDAQQRIAEGNWAARRYASDKSYEGRVYAANHKKSGGSGSGSQKYNVDIIDPVTGEHRTFSVTGNAALKYLEGQYGEDNVTHVTEDDGLGGTKEKTTSSSNGNKNAAAEARRAWNEKHKQKGGNGKPGKGQFSERDLRNATK